MRTGFEKEPKPNGLTIRMNGLEDQPKTHVDQIDINPKFLLSFLHFLVNIFINGQIKQFFEKLTNGIM